MFDTTTSNINDDSTSCNNNKRLRTQKDSSFSKTKNYYKKTRYNMPSNIVVPGKKGLYVQHFRHQQGAAINNVLNFLNKLLVEKFQNQKEEFDEGSNNTNEEIDRDDTDNNNNNVGDDNSVESKLNTEINSLKDDMKSLKKGVYFRALKTGMFNSFFVEILIKSISPIELCKEIYEYLWDNKHDRVYNRHLSGIFPVEASCGINIKEIENSGAKVAQRLDDVLNEDDKEKVSKKFAIAIEKKNTSDELIRSEIIDMIASKVNKIHKVDLTNPDYVIFVYIFRNICCFSLIDYYHKYKKFRLKSFIYGRTDNSKESKSEIENKETHENEELENKKKKENEETETNNEE